MWEAHHPLDDSAPKDVDASETKVVEGDDITAEALLKYNPWQLPEADVGQDFKIETPTGYTNYTYTGVHGTPYNQPDHPWYQYKVETHTLTATKQTEHHRRRGAYSMNADDESDPEPSDDESPIVSLPITLWAPDGNPPC